MNRFAIAASTDVVAMARLHAAAFPDEPWSAQTITEVLQTSGARALAAHADNGMMLGFVLVRTVADEAEILTICVDAAARRRGIGAGILAAAQKAAMCDGAEALFLEAAADNAAALALYRRAGFIDVGRRCGYYRRGAEKIDALVMKLSPIKEI